MSRPEFVRIAAAKAALTASANTGRAVDPRVHQLVHEETAMSDDTAPFDPVSEEPAPWSYPVNRHDEAPVDTGVEPREPKVPEPALIRGAVAAAIGLIGYILGKQIDLVVVDQIMDIYVVAGPFALAWWIRRNVSPVKK